MARAFHDSPNFSYVEPRASRRRQSLAWLLGSPLVRLGIDPGEVTSTDTREGVAVWLAPGTSIGAIAGIRAGFLQAPFRIGVGALARFFALGSQTEKLRSSMAPEPHWYLLALGVDENVQGQGIGGRLMEPVLDRARADGVPCYLETFHERNVRFYQRHGFAEVQERVTTQGLRFWGMKRAACLQSYCVVSLAPQPKKRSKKLRSN